MTLLQKRNLWKQTQAFAVSCGGDASEIWLGFEENVWMGMYLGSWWIIKQAFLATVVTSTLHFNWQPTGVLMDNRHQNKTSKNIDSPCKKVTRVSVDGHNHPSASRKWQLWWSGIAQIEHHCLNEIPGDVNKTCLVMREINVWTRNCSQPATYNHFCVIRMSLRA